MTDVLSSVSIRMLKTIVEEVEDSNLHLDLKVFDNVQIANNAVGDLVYHIFRDHPMMKEESQK